MPAEFIVFFSTNSAALDNKSMRTIVAAANEANQRTWAQVAVAGHADSRGDATANLQLSLGRAIAVRDALVGAGVPASD
jgi:OOP family OmpA-OmpF porin